MNREPEKKSKNQQAIVYLTIPFVLAVPPIVGWGIGFMLDKYFETEPYLMYTFLAFGFIAGCREFYRILKRYGDDV